MVTVHDVAARAGVSIATVSRSLREPDRVIDETRDRVLAAVAELGYRPNRAARSLRHGRTGAIALVVPDIENPYFASLTKGAQATSRAHGYSLVVVDTTESAEVEDEEIGALRSQVDGLILASSRLTEHELARVAAETTSVLINRRLPGAQAPTVTLDEAPGVRAALEHLRALGHRRVLYVGGPDASWTEERRWTALRDAAAADGGMTALRVGPVSPDAAGGRAVAEEALALDATAVIAYNDLVALGLLARWSELGVRVPEDVSLIGFDNTFVAQLASPPLTSVGADLRGFGEAAVLSLLARIDRRDIPAVSTATALTVRGSTAPSRAR